MDLIHNLNLSAQDERLEEKPIICAASTEETNETFRYIEDIIKFIQPKDGGETIKTTESVIAQVALDALYRHIKELEEENIHLKAELTEANNSAAEAKKESYTDPLTGAYSRKYFEDFVNTEFDPKKERLAVVFLDAVKLKMINDDLGHQVGDVLIKTMATSLISLGFNETDFLVRAGGDEFIFVYHLPNEDSFEEAEILDRIKSQINDAKIYLEKTFEDYTVNNKDLFQKQLNYRADFSSGISFSNKDEDLFKTLHRADMLMYEDKRTNAKVSKKSD